MTKYYDYPLKFVRFEQDKRMAAGCGAGQGCFWVTEKWPDWED